MGIDIGNLLTKVAILDGDELLASGTMDTTGNVATEIDGLIARVLSDAGLTPEDIGATAFTGGNAELVDGRGVVEDAVTCVAAAGAYYLPDVNLVVDIGGQSITSILLDADGDVINFMRNDKCASGSGRFLEVMSQAIGVGVESISDAARGATGAVSISSQCGVFAESEVITHLNAGEEPAEIVAGLCDSVASIVAAQARRFATGDCYTLTGGVTRVDAVVSRIKEKLEGTCHDFPYDPGLAACIGAALLAGLDDL